MVKYFNYVEPELQKMMYQWMADYEVNYGISCKYKRFSIVEKANDGEIIGVLLGHIAFAEIHVEHIYL